MAKQHKQKNTKMLSSVLAKSYDGSLGKVETVLDEFENQRFIDPKFVTLFTGYLTILDSISIHTDSEFYGTMPLPESEEVFNTNKWS